MRDLIDFIREYSEDNFLRENNCEMLSFLGCELAYFDWNKCKYMGIKNHMIPISSLKNCDVSNNKFAEDVWNALTNNEILLNSKVGYFREELDLKRNMQYAVITIEINGINYICFRGTDTTIAGWKEDMDFGYEKAIPSQKLALEYIKKVSKKLKGKIVVSGHSKGGNLAIFASAFAPDSIKNRINSIISLDGVGFRNSFYASKEYDSIRRKTTKIVPYHSFVGLLLGNDRKTKFKVIDARSYGFAQHDLSNWKVEDNDFVAKKAVGNRQKTLARNVNLWIYNFKKDEARKLMNTLYSITNGYDMVDIKDVVKKPISLFNATAKKFFESDSKNRKEATKIVGDFLGAIVAW